MADQSGGSDRVNHYPRREQGVIVDVVDNSSVKARAVIDSLVDILGADAIHSVIPKSGNSYEVVLADEEIVKLAVGIIKVGNSNFQCRELVNQTMVVSFMHVSAFVTDESIREKLWGDFKVETVGHFQHRRHSDSKYYDGTRFVRVKFPPGMNSLPYTMKFYNGETWDYVRVIHNDQQKLCRLCNSPDHTMRDCPDFVCYKCGEQGHMARACQALRCYACRRFGSKCTCMSDDDSEDGYLCETCGDRNCSCVREKSCDRCGKDECVCSGDGDGEYMCDQCGVHDCTCSDSRDEVLLCDKCGRTDCVCSSLCDKCGCSVCQCVDRPSCFDVDDLPLGVLDDAVTSVSAAGDVVDSVVDAVAVDDGVAADSVGAEVIVSIVGVHAAADSTAVAGTSAVVGDAGTAPAPDVTPDVGVGAGDLTGTDGETPGVPTETDGIGTSDNIETDMQYDDNENSSDTYLCDVCGSGPCQCVNECASSKPTKRRRMIEVIPNIKCARSSSTKL